ncbi:hypothetical protein J2751_003165 [Halorubrum alkaliphilum]|uniref:Uncharacterized protein n=1 Tax=Halorubrum alkaliphilum TaxID=261290 RepID=A0A8T4GHR6_9EURY|nr:hypothetical protein [Halorubrum alkaliphilum]
MKWRLPLRNLADVSFDSLIEPVEIIELVDCNVPAV